MASSSVRISDLPVELTPQQAVEAVYREELDRIEDKLDKGLSVLVECDKQLNFYLYRALRARLRRTQGGVSLHMISGHEAPANDALAGPPQSMMQHMLAELKGAIYSAATNAVLVLPHLDVLTTTTRASLGLETREAAAMLYENPDMIYLGFKDPSFEIPPVIARVFTVRQTIMGIPRDALPRVILQREARKLAVEDFNAFSLYKYVSGLNAVRVRQILAHFQTRLDFDPANPASAEAIYREIREMTVVGDVELPRVDMETDIGGYSEVKRQLKREVLDLLELKDQSTDPAEVSRIEELVPKGMILHGPPGTGKTFFAKAIASALDATITVVSGPELKSMWVGESEENLRRIFSDARKSAPAIIVFDELDSFASARGTYTGSGVEHSMVNQLLTEMDGFRKDELVFVVGTTNLVASLDPALLRPGRFELRIEIPYPAAQDRREIIDIYARKFGLDMCADVIDHMVQRTSGYVEVTHGTRFSGDHLYAIARALKRDELRRGTGATPITCDDVDQAIRQRKTSRVQLKAKEERTIAVHEAGHAVCAYVLPHCPTIERVSIATAEEDVLGYTLQAVKENKYITTCNELLDDICVLMGGRMAEHIIIGEISVGSYDDLQRATAIASFMVEELGMGKDLGLRTFAGQQQRAEVADATAQRIDAAIDELLEQQRARAEELVTRHRAQLEPLVEALLVQKTVDLETLEQIFDGQRFKTSDADAT